MELTDSVVLFNFSLSFYFDFDVLKIFSGNALALVRVGNDKFEASTITISTPKP